MGGVSTEDLIIRRRAGEALHRWAGEGAGSPAETSVSVVAEVIVTRSGRAGAPLGGTAGRIGG
jgi:hypothetical protein